MSDEYIRSLARKWLAGTATEEETAALMQWYGKEEEKKQKSVWWIGIAATVLLTAGVWWMMKKPEGRKMAVYVPREQQNRVVLPDSSVVWLNADSKLQYREDTLSREVTLTGEGFFDVSKRTKPFVVKAGRCITTVLGTSFNIKAYNNEAVAITVASGKIQVQDEKKHISILTANKQITLEKTTVERTVNATVAHAWIHGRFEIDNETFETVANNLSRKYGVTFHFENDALRQCTFIASFDEHATLERILGLLCKINNSTFRISEDQQEVYISGQGCSL
ncbi:FecR family protein [Chitinophaga pinensis]|uniref:Anti-FecI sigma factor, FecR n=1 Tax=Chitinophaga pinensis (strain ATCC 43595 / DSM 2588 / LMG 13176 / NBRC 15968 / NCIMB 11800 / UQM 2034) TaxID=485918 RepID=A0A979GBX9_CHIPD|nr:FecR family protein [Chitinophaga pinensis]ACU64635.1 anti-FecI sigma factor, FecR [Chitinophaga pinensis DSM 2588]